MSWQIQEGVNLGHTDSLWTVSNFYNVIACTNFSLRQHAKVRRWSSMCYEKRRHTRFMHANSASPMRYRSPMHTWLSGSFLELAESKITAAQKALPVMVRIHLADEHGAVLPVTIDIEFAHHSPSP
jgi:hypothetical protein